MNPNKSILIVDDKLARRSELAAGLSNYKYDIESVDNGISAINVFDYNPQKFDFVLIDHSLSEDNNLSAIDGIETCKQIHDRNKETKIIIYSYIPSDDPITIERFKKLAYNAGAVRYIRRTSSDTPVKIINFIDEISTLNKLSIKLNEFHAFFKEIPSLFDHLKIGVSLIDCEKKIWYASPEFKNMFGLRDDEINGHCSNAFHGFSYACDGCLLNFSSSNQKSGERISLQPIKNLDNELRYIKIWTQMVFDNENRMIGILKSAQDLTNSTVLKGMSLKDILDIISDGLYQNENGFDVIRIYKFESNYKFKLLSLRTDQETSIPEGVFNISDAKYISDAIKHFKRSRAPLLFERNIYGDSIIADISKFPLMILPIYNIQDELIGVISVNDGLRKKCTSDKIFILEKYAEEVKKAIEYQNLEYSKETIIFEILSEIDNLIIQANSTSDVFMILLKSICKYTNSISAHVRYRVGDRAILHPIFIGDYPSKASPDWSISRRESLACRVLLSQKELLLNNILSDRNILSFRNRLTENAKNSLDQSKSLFFIPLHFIDECIGVLGIHSDVINNYDDKKIIISRAISKKIATVLHDYIIQNKEIMAYKKAMIDLVHTMRSPLHAGMTIQNVIIKKFNRPKLNKKSLGDIKEDLSLLSYSLNEVSEIVSRFLYLDDYRTSKKERCYIDPIITENAEYFTKFYQNIAFKLNLNCDKVSLFIDKQKMSEALKELIHNSVVAMKKTGTITINTTIKADYIFIELEDEGPGIDIVFANKFFSEINYDTQASVRGRGLQFVRNVIVDDHKGIIKFSLTPYNSTNVLISLNYSNQS